MATRNQLSGWQLASDSASAYEQYLVPAIFRQGAAKLVDGAEIRPGERVLDVGCGTGIVARTAAERAGASGSVIGVDLNPGMLEVARSISSEIDWRQGAAEDLPVARRAVDAVLSQQAFQFFEDRQKSLQEMRRVLAPGGRVVFSVLRSMEHNHTYQPLVNAFARHGGDDLGTMMSAPFQNWTADELRQMVRAAGFATVSIRLDVITARFPSVQEFIEWELSSSPLSAYVSGMDVEVRDSILRDVESDLGDYVDDGGVFHPLQTYVVTARE